MMPAVPPRREHSDAEIEAAVQVLSEPERLEEAQRVVASAAPALQAILENALEAAEWFGSAHRAQVHGGHRPGGPDGAPGRRAAPDRRGDARVDARSAWPSGTSLRTC